jgi:hypothetical protein|tara:strand:- start:157 stop:360 length:204 start_codon:yes stop_codon:yes gene_type:complete
MTHSETPTTVSATAERVLFKLQFMSLMAMSGRMDEADTAFQQAQVILGDLITDAKKLESDIDSVMSL